MLINCQLAAFGVDTDLAAFCREGYDLYAVSRDQLEVQLTIDIVLTLQRNSLGVELACFICADEGVCYVAIGLTCVSDTIVHNLYFCRIHNDRYIAVCVGTVFICFSCNGQRFCCNGHCCIRCDIFHCVCAQRLYITVCSYIPFCIL